MARTTPLISHWLSWNQRTSHSIHIGHDHILGLGDSSFLSIQLINYLHSSHICYLLHAKDTTGFDSTSHCWHSSVDLGLQVALAEEWDTCIKSLSSAGIKLHEREDALLWIGGDSSGCPSVSNIYTAITNLHWSLSTDGRRKNIWSWNIPQKIKLFTWLTIENKVNTWDILQKKGWIGPSLCHLCLREEESTLHLFVHFPFTRRVWARIIVVQHISTTQDGFSLLDCYKCWSIKQRSHLALPPFIYWCVWLERNNIIFVNGIPSTSTIVYKALGSLTN